MKTTKFYYDLKLIIMMNLSQCKVYASRAANCFLPVAFPISRSLCIFYFELSFILMSFLDFP